MSEKHKDELVNLLVDAEPSAGAVFLPERRLSNGLGVYDEVVAIFFKELSAKGVAVVWADSPEQRTFRAERSLDPNTWSAIVGFPWGVASNATWDAIKLLFSQIPYVSRRLHVELAKQTDPDGKRWEWATFDGDGAEVAMAMEAYVRACKSNE